MYKNKLETVANGLEAVEQLSKTFNHYISLPSLQYFAGEDDLAAGGGEDDLEEKKDDQLDDDKKDDQVDLTKNEQRQAEKLFNQDQVNDFVSRETKKEQEKLFKKLGVKDFDSAKDALKKFNKIQEDQKTEAQKLEDNNKTLETERNNYMTEAENAKAELSALKKDVSPDSVSDVIVLAKNLVTDEVDLNDAIDEVLKKYPNFKRVQATDEDEQGTKKKKPNFTQGKHKTEKQTEDEKFTNAFGSWLK